MYRNKNLLAHPNKLIFFMCIAEAVAAWHAILAHLGIAQVICYFNLQDLLAWSTFDLRTEPQYIQLLERSNFNILSFAEFFSLALNSFLCLDIFYTLRNPFYPHERRMKFYLWGSGVIGFICFMCTLCRFNDDSYGTKIPTRTQAIFSCSILTLYFAFSVLSVTYAWRISTRPGMSSGTRHSFIVRHAKYVATYMVTWVAYYGFSFFVLFVSTFGPQDISYTQIMGQSDKMSNSFTFWLSAWNFSCILTGLLMSLVRITEPIFW